MEKVGDVMKDLRFWCYKVLPLVYDDSLSYYEVLCKVVKYINDLIAQDKVLAGEIESADKAIKEAQDLIKKWQSEGDRWFNEWAQGHLANMIMVGITDAGYIVYDIPRMWEQIVFNTTGLDINLDLQPEYGHLVLSY